MDATHVTVYVVDGAQVVADRMTTELGEFDVLRVTTSAGVVTLAASSRRQLRRFAVKAMTAASEGAGR